MYFFRCSRTSRRRCFVESNERIIDVLKKKERERQQTESSDFIMFTSLKNKIREETGNDVCAQHPAFSSHRRNSLSLNNFNNNNNNIIDTSLNGAYTPSPHSSNGTLNNNQQRFTTIISPIDQLNAIITQKNEEITTLIEKLNESDGKFTKLSTEYDDICAVKDRLEKSNSILEDALKVAQEQKELIHNEQDKIQNLQAQEISKLKSLLHFREQVGIFIQVISELIPFFFISSVQIL